MKKKFFKYYVISLFTLSFFFSIKNTNAQSYSISYFDTNIGVNGFAKSNEQTMNNLKSVDLQFNNNNYFSTVYFNELWGGVTIDNNINLLTFPISITDLNNESNLLTCRTTTYTSDRYDFNYQTLYADQSLSSASGTIHQTTQNKYCETWNLTTNNDYSINVGYQLNDNTTYNCLVTEVDGSNQVLCPIQQAKANGQYKITQVFIVFTRKNSDNTTQVRVRMSMNLIKQTDTEQKILDVLNDLNSKINQSNNIQSQIQNNTNEIKNDIKSDNISGASGSADDLKNNSAFQDSTGLSAIVSMPLSIINSFSNTCQPITLSFPYFDNFEIPCFQAYISSKIPALANLLKIVINGFLIYRVLLDIFRIVRGARNPDDDRIEVLDL